MNTPYKLSFGDKTYCGRCHKPLLMLVPDWSTLTERDEVPLTFVICRHCLTVSQVIHGVGHRKVEWYSPGRNLRLQAIRKDDARLKTMSRRCPMVEHFLPRLDGDFMDRQGFEAEVVEGFSATCNCAFNHFFVRCWTGECLILDITADQFNEDIGDDDPQPAVVMLVPGEQQRYQIHRTWLVKPQLVEVIHNRGDWDGPATWKNRIVYTFEHVGKTYLGKTYLGNLPRDNLLREKDISHRPVFSLFPVFLYGLFAHFHTVPFVPNVCPLPMGTKSITQFA